MTDRIPHPGEQHPEEWREDLNPNANAGQNYGTAGTEASEQTRTMYDIKDLHNAFDGISDDELKRVPVLAPGTRLQQGATYIDLQTPDRAEFKALGAMEARDTNWYVPKSEVDYQVWNRLIGVTNPERLGEADEG